MEDEVLRHSCDLLESDAENLNAKGPAWETIIDGNSKGLIIVEEWFLKEVRKNG
ncbi:MAG: hypothetical protein ABIJ86_08855 [Spirochaetota bacterium]